MPAQSAAMGFWMPVKALTRPREVNRYEIGETLGKGAFGK